ncbi:hypothetical protein DICA3_B10814 [Diutina catenulata]
MNKRVATTPLKANNIRRKLELKPPPKNPGVALHFHNWLLTKQLHHQRELTQFLEMERQFSMI